MTDSSNDASRIIDSWYLGKTSATHETSGRGVAMISTGRGDNGGVSYGAYQLSTNAATLDRYLEQSSYRHHFSGLTPATDAFDAKWRELARSEPGFAAEQHDFIRRTHYDIRIRELQAKGIDLTDRGRAVQDALWSTSVQFGGKTKKVVGFGLVEKFGSNYKLWQLSDKDIVEAIQDYKIAHNSELFESSRANWNGLLRRAREEKNDLVQLAIHEATLAREGLLTDRRQSMAPSQSTVMQRNSGQPATDAVQTVLNSLGYTDARGHMLEVDGRYGKRTREAIAAFQRDRGLNADGIAGPNTWAALQEATRTASDIPAITVEPPAIDHSLMVPSPDLNTAAITTLQQQLQTLGMTDHRGQPLPVTGTYDDTTRVTVTMFQKEQGLPGTGVPDPATRALIEARATIAELQQVERADPASQQDMPLRQGKHGPAATAESAAYPNHGAPSQPAGQSEAQEPALDDPRNAHNPHHALYNELHRRIPDASEKRLLQFTAACHAHDINVDNLAKIYFDRQNGTMTFSTSWPPIPSAVVDLKVPSPEPQQSIQHIHQFDQWHVQMMSDIRAHRAQVEAQAQQGPMLGGPMR